jgi:anti-sigma B factor antagonist
MAISTTHDRLLGQLAPFDVRVRPDRDTIYIEPIGELDLASCARLRAELHELLAAGFSHVVIDLRDLTFLDTTGIELLIALNAQAQRDGWQLALIPGPPDVHRVFKLTATLDALPFTPAASHAAQSR